MATGDSGCWTIWHTHLYFILVICTDKSKMFFQFYRHLYSVFVQACTVGVVIMFFSNCPLLNHKVHLKLSSLVQSSMHILVLVPELESEPLERQYDFLLKFGKPWQLLHIACKGGLLISLMTYTNYFSVYSSGVTLIIYGISAFCL